ncbi:HEC/Ndc80p family protein [Babesia caballi]|uniref:HEC/Ndc80p family protein n=1 Tax=Babesia caballi TaxID=5871 RepID=A0AAV4M2L1_BABCB|nr:HEC/Ndc80p family protein [Babesia caballi]
MESVLSSLKNAKSALSGQAPAASRQNAPPTATKTQLTNKKECVQCILGFLASRGFHPCTAKELLRSPPLQILLDIWNFLFRLLDPSANVTKENMAVEVPKFFKDFGYPHIMKTSHLRTPTADHQWEANLVALSWLCKLLLYEQECFDRPFEIANKPQQPAMLGLEIGANGKATITNSMVARFVTEQATQHFQLYVRGEVNSVQLTSEFRSAVADLLAVLQESVDDKMAHLEELRNRTLELQKELESFARTKEWIATASSELQRIEELTGSLRASCEQAAETLRKHKQALREEEAALAAQEEQNSELERQIELQTINKNVVRDLNQALKALKARIADGSRRIKELEHEIATTEAGAHAVEASLVAAHKALSSTHESIKNFLMNNGQHAESWRSLGALRVNARGSQESEVLGTSAAAYRGVLEEVINKDRELMRLSGETRAELERANRQLEEFGNALTRETADALRETASVVKQQLLDEQDSHLQLEASKLADVIRAAAKEDLDRARRELERAEAAVAEAQNRLRQQEARAQGTWRELVARFREMFRAACETKESNRQALRGLAAGGAGRGGPRGGVLGEGVAGVEKVGRHDVAIDVPDPDGQGPPEAPEAPVPQAPVGRQGRQGGQGEEVDQVQEAGQRVAEGRQLEQEDNRHDPQIDVQPVQAKGLPHQGAVADGGLGAVGEVRVVLLILGLDAVALPPHGRAQRSVEREAVRGPAGALLRGAVQDRLLVGVEEPVLPVEMCGASCAVRGLQRQVAVAVRKTAEASRRFSVSAFDADTRRHMSAAALLQKLAAPTLGAKFAAVGAAHLHSGAEPAAAVPCVSASNSENSGEGAVTCAGDEEDTEGTESGRVTRRGRGADLPPSDGEGEREEAHVAGAEESSQTASQTASGRFKEYGNVYAKHEPTMFGDWSHMGRLEYQFCGEPRRRHFRQPDARPRRQWPLGERELHVLVQQAAVLQQPRLVGLEVAVARAAHLDQHGVGRHRHGRVAVDVVAQHRHLDLRGVPVVAREDVAADEQTLDHVVAAQRKHRGHVDADGVARRPDHHVGARRRGPLVVHLDQRALTRQGPGRLVHAEDERLALLRVDVAREVEGAAGAGERRAPRVEELAVERAAEERVGAAQRRGGRARLGRAGGGRAHAGILEDAADDVLVLRAGRRAEGVGARVRLALLQEGIQLGLGVDRRGLRRRPGVRLAFAPVGDVVGHVRRCHRPRAHGD